MQPHFELPQRTAEVPSGYVRQMSKGKLLIPGKSIELQDCIGQGEPTLALYPGAGDPQHLGMRLSLHMRNHADLSLTCVQ